jgi:hypothetical protein
MGQPITKINTLMQCRGTILVPKPLRKTFGLVTSMDTKLLLITEKSWDSRQDAVCMRWSVGLLTTTGRTYALLGAFPVESPTCSSRKTDGPEYFF